jgi:hypothetical protein
MDRGSAKPAQEIHFTAAAADGCVRECRGLANWLGDALIRILQGQRDRLTNDIAKLEGKRQNNLQLALDEARVTADHLAESLEKDLTAINKLLKDENINAFKGFFTR